MSENKQNTEAQNKENRKELLQNEPNIIDGLRRLRSITEEEALTQRIHIGDMENDGKELFSFRIRPLKETEFEKARDKAKAKRPDDFGNRPVDEAKYRAHLIYLATVDEDKAKIWDNPEVLNMFDTNFYYDVIDALPAGYKLKIQNAIERLSGYGLNQDVIDVEELKN